jgi:hypothetical protein
LLFDLPGRPLEPEARLVKQTVSAERGQLLLFLTNVRAAQTQISRFGGDFAESNLSNREISDARLGDLRKASLRGSTLRQTDFLGDFSGANFSCATLIRSTLREANLTEAKFEHAKLDDVDLTLRAFVQADLSKAFFNVVRVHGVPAALNEGPESRSLDQVLRDLFPREIGRKPYRGFLLDRLSGNPPRFIVVGPMVSSAEAEKACAVQPTAL